MNTKILSSANPTREAAALYIKKFAITEWNQEIHARFIIWLAIELGLLDPTVPEHKAFASMLGFYGLAGNASQFGQCLTKEAGKHVLGGLLTSRNKSGSSSLDAFLLVSFAPEV